jgi:membrane-bound metal-dependent hydrolase YbcI (DUF457 family)
MFLGHFGVAFAARRAAPEVSLGTLFAAAQAADLLWPNLVLAGIERVEIEPGATVVTPLDFVYYPWSHSLLAMSVLGLLAAGLWRLLREGRYESALVVLATILSHWFLDLVVHRPDLPLAPGEGPLLGLGLWNSLPATLAVEGGLLAVGLALYLRSSRARDRVGSFGLGALVAFLVLVYLASVFGPPPPSSDAVAWVAQSMWLLVVWGWWVDRHRESVAVARPSPAPAT